MFWKLYRIAKFLFMEIKKHIQWHHGADMVSIRSFRRKIYAKARKKEWKRNKLSQQGIRKELKIYRTLCWDIRSQWERFWSNMAFIVRFITRFITRLCDGNADLAVWDFLKRGKCQWRHDGVSSKKCWVTRKTFFKLT